MPHYVFQDGDDNVLAVAMDISEARSHEIADDLREQRLADGMRTSLAHVFRSEVPAYAPRPVKEGDIITGKKAMTLPRDSVVLPATSQVPMLRGPRGYMDSWGGDAVQLGGDRYRVLHVGRR
jgi:hypothetical protein